MTDLREAVRLCLTKAGMTVKRKNAAADPTAPHIILTDLVGTSRTLGILLTIGGAQDTGDVVGTSSKAHIALWRAGFRVRCNDWNTLVVTDHA